MEDVYCVGCDELVTYYTKDSMEEFTIMGKIKDILIRSAFCDKCNGYVYPKEVLDFNMKSQEESCR